MRRSALCLLVVLVGALACGGGGSVRVANSGADELCSTLKNYCVQVTCTVENTSAQPTTATVAFRLDQEDGHSLKHLEIVNLGAGEMRSLEHEFDDAKLIGGIRDFSCAVE